jgi:hypothetical protein
MKDFILRLLIDLKKGQNVDLIVILFMGILISILNIIGIINENLLSSVTLATLALIAVSLLVSRYKLDDICVNRNENNTVELNAGKIQTLDSYLQKSDEIWMVGILLKTTTTDNYFTFKEKAKNGLKIKALIVNLEDIDVDKLVKRFSRSGNVKHFIGDMEHVENQYKAFNKVASEPRNIQLKLLDFVPTFSMYIFPDKNKCGKAIIETYCYKSSKGAIPKFTVCERNQPDWYRHFTKQFELMWADSCEFKLETEMGDEN